MLLVGWLVGWNTYTINYLTQRQEHLANRVVPTEPIVVEHVQMQHTRLQLLYREALKVERLVPARIQRAPLDLRLQPVFFVRQQGDLDVRIGGAAEIFGRQLFALHDLQDERAVLEVVLNGEVYLADVLAGLGVVDVHVHHADAAVLRGAGENESWSVRERAEMGNGWRGTLTPPLPAAASAATLAPTGERVCGLDDLDEECTNKH